MKKNKTRIKIGVFEFLIFSTPAFVSIATSSLISLDSINIPKYIITVTMGFSSVGYILYNLSYFKSKFNKKYLYLSTIFFATILSSFIFRNAPWEQVLFGREGRLNGVITYFSIIAISISTFLIIMFQNFDEKLDLVIKSIALAGTANLIYGYIQLFGLDPIRWSTTTNSIFGFFGNPNFLSAFVAASYISVIYEISKFRIKKLIKTSIQVLISISYIYLIYRTLSYQGFIVFAFSILIFTTILFYQNKNRIGLVFQTIFGASIVVLAGLGTLNYGPLSNILYKQSIASRGDFFRSGINMGFHNLANGVGLDSFSDYYYLYRDSIAASHSFAEFADSAHNYFIDIFAQLGLPGLLSYLCLHIYILFIIVNLIRKTRNFRINILIATYFGFLIQSLVSPSNLVFNLWITSLWGIFSGIYGQIQSKNELNLKLKSGFLPIIGIIIGIALTFPIASRDFLLRQASNELNANKYLIALERFPKSSPSYQKAILSFEKSNLPQIALDLAKRSIKFNDRSTIAYYEIITSNLTSLEEKRKSLKKLIKLDPENIKLKDVLKKI